MRFLTDAEREAYVIGLLEGVERYAYTSSEPWALNGVHYVGTTGTTLEYAKERILRQHGFGVDPRRMVPANSKFFM